MLDLEKLTMKNFFSFGNVPQEVHLVNDDIVLVLGQNRDAPKEDEESGERRNGVGKSAIIQAIVFALYGKSIGNDIKIPNLVNKTNPKYCEVQLEFSKDGVKYKIERGRNPTYFHFYKLDPNGNKIDDSRGETKDTQEDLQEVIGISQLLFEYLVVMNANVEPFLALNAQKQRDIVEELLGITQLTEKAEALKEVQKENAKAAQLEKFRLETIAESNKRIEQSINVLQAQAEEFQRTKEQNISRIQEEITTYSALDFNSLLELAHKMDLAIQNNNKRKECERRVSELVLKCQSYDETLLEEKNKVLKDISDLETIDIDKEIQSHKELLEYHKLVQDRLVALNSKSSLQTQITRLEFNLSDLNSRLKSENDKLQSVLDNKCPLCMNNLECSDTSILDKINTDLSVITNSIEQTNNQIVALKEQENSIIITELPEKPRTVYSSISDAKLHEHKLLELRNLSTIEKKNIYTDELISAFDTLENIPEMQYEETIPASDVKELQMYYNNLLQDLSREQNSVNPYFDQIETLKTNSIKEVDYTEYNALVKMAEHQDFVVKLLLNKDSFVRKRIIEQNIHYLNSRLQYYIEKVGSLHGVEFMNDLSVYINLNDMSYDFKQLSRGERTRVVIALNMAFRDVYESISPINLLCCDELIDNGLDASGIEMMWDIFNSFCEEKKKSVLLISHREELYSRAKSILHVVKEDGFSTVEYS